LKVAEARAIRIDTTEKVREELQKYGDQLIKSNFDKEVLDPAAMRLYDRLQKEKLVYHVMIRAEAGKDTAAAIQILNTARDRVLKGEDFSKVAAEVSTDTSNKKDPGLIGWITANQIPDADFENMVFNTSKGAVSPVFKSKFGYHFLKVAEERPAQGTVTVAHILIKTPKNAKPEEIAAAKHKADSVYGLLKQGNDFAAMASQYSDDKTSAAGGGRLEPFSTGKMVLPFQEAAFALKNTGDISEPVQTAFGWHIIMLIEKKPIGTYEDMKADLKTKVERSAEYKTLRADFVTRVKQSYPFSENSDAINAVFATLDSSFIKNTWTDEKAAGLNSPVFTIGDFVCTQADLAAFLEMNQRSSREKDIAVKSEKIYSELLEQSLIEYDLSVRNIDFKRLMQEYRDGIPLFALLEQKVWSMAAKDTAGLEKFYEENKMNYMWEERAEASIYTVFQADILKDVKKLATKNTPDSTVMAKYNTDSVTVVKAVTSFYLPGQNSDVDNMNKQPGLSSDILNADGSVTFVRLIRVVPPTPKTLKEARGYVISNYQDYLEKKWIEELHKKYPVVVNETVFNSMVK
jgi:peptidyl-prolyl cis-trans isomerase SurA